MAYRNKTYICFDADEDMIYYQLMRAWKAKDGKEFQFHNAHDLFPMQNRKLDINDEIYIKGKLRERLLNTKCFIILVGQKNKKPI
ncbi:TIR domain-containing protein [Bacillus toyonensis]